MFCSVIGFDKILVGSKFDSLGIGSNMLLYMKNTEMKAISIQNGYPTTFTININDCTGDNSTSITGSLGNIFVQCKDRSIYSVRIADYLTNLESAVPRCIGNHFLVRLIAAGHYHCLFLMRNGTLYSHGNGNHGELGVGLTVSYTDTLLQVPIPNGESAVEISAGCRFSLFITDSSRTVYSFGCGAYYRLGHGDDCDLLSPTPLLFLSSKGRAKQCACGTWHCIVVMMHTNEVYGWGWNRYGQVGMPQDDFQIAEEMIIYPKQILNHLINGSLSYKMIVCGSRHSAFLTNDGAVIVLGVIGGFTDNYSVDQSAIEIISIDDNINSVTYDQSLLAWCCDKNTRMLPVQKLFNMNNQTEESFVGDLQQRTGPIVQSISCSIWSLLIQF
eukprot:gene11803-15795_t